MTTINRSKLLAALAICRPALASQAFVPAYTHYLFKGTGVTAYNDLLGIWTKLDHAVDGCLPGTALVQALQSMTGEEVLMQQHRSEKSMQVAQGRSRMTLPLLDASDFPIRWPDVKGEPYVPVSADMIKGIAACLPGVGTNAGQPAQMGLTLEAGEVGPVLWATDGNTLSQYVCDADKEFKLPGDVPVILPTQFCEQLLALSKALPHALIDLFVVPGAVMAEALDQDEKPVARVMSRTLVDVTPLDFAAVKRKHTSGAPGFKPMPPGWDDALARALVVTANEVDRVMVLSGARKALKLTAAGAVGESVDELDFEGEPPEGSDRIDPVLVVRGSKMADSMAFGSHALLLRGRDGKFFHMIAHYGS